MYVLEKDIVIADGFDGGREVVILINFIRSIRSNHYD